MLLLLVLGYSSKGGETLSAADKKKKKKFVQAHQSVAAFHSYFYWTHGQQITLTASVNFYNWVLVKEQTTGNTHSSPSHSARTCWF